MDEQLREAIGKAIYIKLTLDALPWDRLSEMTQEEYRKAAEAAVSAFLAHVRDNYGKGDKVE